MSLSWKKIIYYLILIAGVSVFTYYSLQKKNDPVRPAPSAVPVSQKESGNLQKPAVRDTKPVSPNPAIPDYVIKVLHHILKYQEAPPNYVGGRIFENREDKLNTYDRSGAFIQYKEWDVHPKVKGQNRGPERLITGSDHSAYYTFNHYQTFYKIKL